MPFKNEGKIKTKTLSSKLKKFTFRATLQEILMKSLQAKGK